MPYYDKSEDWLHQSALLLQARPSTTRITTRYHLKPARRPRKSKKSGSGEAAATSTEEGDAQQQQQQQQQQQKPPRGHLVLKTYDAASGATLKYKTSKAAEVTRLVQMLGTLGRRMAALPVPETTSLPPTATATAARGDDVVMGEAAAGAEGSGVQTPTGSSTAAVTPGAGGGAVAGQGQGQGQGQQAGGGGGGGKGKKKKGKR